MFSFFQFVNSGFPIVTFKERRICLTFVKDVAKAVAGAIASVGDGKTYFIAEEKDYSWRDMYEILALVMNKKITVLKAPDAVFYLAAFVSEKFNALLGRDAVFNRQKAEELLQDAWTCSDENSGNDLNVEFTDFFSGAKITYNWYRENGWL